VKPWVSSPKPSKPRQGRQKTNPRIYLSPHPGLDAVLFIHPRLAPWATFFRRSATQVSPKLWRNYESRYLDPCGLGQNPGPFPTAQMAIADFRKPFSPAKQVCGISIGLFGTGGRSSLAQK
jgi:hypothetical protein